MRGQKYKPLTDLYHNSKPVLAALALCLFVALLCTDMVYAQSIKAGEPIENTLGSTKEARKIGDELSRLKTPDFETIMPGYDPEKLMSDASKGSFKFDMTGILNRILSFVFKEVYANIHIMIKLIIIVILCSILKNLQSSFMKESVSEMAFYACYIVIVSITVLSFNTALNAGRDIIDTVTAFMHSTIPVLITILISGGNFTTGGLFEPLLFMGIEVCVTIMKNFLIPLVFLSTVLSIINNISDKIQISKLAEFLKQIAVWSLGIILTVFVAALTIQGSFGAVVDGVTSKTAKFALGAFIPVAGKYLADAADTVVGCTLLIKNASGLAVMIGIIAICLVPLLKIFALAAVYKITCAVIEPISEKRITECINTVSSSISYVLGIVASVVAMFLIMVTAIIGASSMSAMIR